MKIVWKMIARVASVCAALFLLVTPLSMAQTAAPTGTTLTISPSNSVSAATVLTLTATVTSGGSLVHPGQVLFCNAGAAHCNQPAILGQAQITSAGIATLRLRLGVGSHSIKAIFPGTPHSATPRAASTSLTESLEITGLAPTTTTLSSTGMPGDMTFTGTVNAFGRSIPGGTLSFLDTDHGDLSLGSFSLDWVTAPLSFVTRPPMTAFGSYGPVADFNNDGIPDLFGFDSHSDLMLLGNGDGTFRSLPVTNFPSTGAWVTVGDFNSDGIPDLEVTNATGGNNPGVITIMLGDGNGTFTVKSVIPGKALFQAVVADFNGDGIPDLATIAGPYIDLLLGNGDGTFRVVDAIDISPQFLSVLVSADFNGDGIPDLAVQESAGYTQTALIYLGNGDGSFNLKATYVISGSLSLGSFNGDGIPDLAFIGGTLLGKGDGTFTFVASHTTVSDGPDAVADFNGDGIDDLIVGNYGSDANSDATILLGKGDGTFTDGLKISTPYLNLPFVADLNGDGITDFGWSAYGNNGLNVELGGFTASASISGVSLTTGGPHNIVAAYSGDANYAASDSGPAAPVFSPAAGTYQWTQYVTLSDSAPGSVIYYTLDGSTPTPASSRYAAPIQVTWQTTIRAIGVTAALGSSPISIGGFVIARPLPPPIFSAPSGTYSAPFTFTLKPDPASCKSGTCELYYDVGGAGFVRYYGPVTLTEYEGVKIKAITTEWHYTTSAASSVDYTIR